MTRSRWIAALVSLVVVLIAAVVWSQSVPRATATMHIAWEQDAESLADASAYRYTTFLDGATTGTVVTATCSGAASPFVCLMPMPTTVLGPHTVVLSAEMPLGDGSVWSEAALSQPFAFRVVGPVVEPVRLHVVN